MARMVGRDGLVGMVLALSVVAACGSSMPPASEMTDMHFVATTTVPANQPPSVSLLLGQSEAQTIYSMTLALPAHPPGTYNCPIDFGVVYNMEFDAGTATAATATLEPNGCQLVRFSGSNEVRYVPDETYWVALAQQLGIAESTIYPYAP